jgi:hypothetical protein
MATSSILSDQLCSDEPADDAKLLEFAVDFVETFLSQIGHSHQEKGSHGDQVSDCSDSNPLQSVVGTIREVQLLYCGVAVLRCRSGGGDLGRLWFVEFRYRGGLLSGHGDPL